MAQTRVIQRRIRSVRNAKQITKALEVVAASRMRRVVELVDGARAYGELAAGIMQRISSSPEARSTVYFGNDSEGPALYVIFTSDRGQAGAFNSNIFNLALKLAESERSEPQIVVFGRKGTRFFARLSGLDLIGTYEDLADSPDVNVFAPVVETIVDGLNEAKFSRVVIFYTTFESSLSQKATSFQLFPADLSQMAADEAVAASKVYEFEPDIKDVLDEAIGLYAQAKLVQSKIDSAASEHAMRMMAMGNANRNASDLIDNLTLELNATRQAAITQEIAEITGGAAAIAQ